MLRLAGDDRLVALVRQGSDGAFEAIYDRHHAALLSFSRHMVGNREDAEDVVQHTFVAAHRAIHRDERELRVRAWLFTIARNRCLDLLRARREAPGERDLEVATEGLATAVERREDLRALLDDLAGLPEPQRAALVLAELRAMSHGEIATVVGVPTAKVKALVFQARENLAMSRRARETPCAEIREELAVSSGRVWRRAPLRRHLELCPGCRAYRDEIRRQRRALAVLLPVVPTATLKTAVLQGIAGGGGGAAAAGGGVLAVGLAKSGVAKLAAVVALAGSVATGVDVIHHARPPTRAAAEERAPTVRPAPPARATRSPTASTTVHRGVGRAATGRAAAPHGERRAARSAARARATHVRAHAGASPPGRVPAAGASIAPAAVTSPTPPAGSSQGSAHRSQAGASHAADPIRAGGTVAPRINARGRALGAGRSASRAGSTGHGHDDAGETSDPPAAPAKPAHPAHPAHPARPAKGR